MRSLERDLNKTTKKPLVLIAVMLAMFMGAIEATDCINGHACHCR